MKSRDIRGIDNEEADAQLPNRKWFSAPAKSTIILIALIFGVFVFVASNLVLNGGGKKEEKITPRVDAGGIPFRRTEAAPPAPEFKFSKFTPEKPIEGAPPSPLRGKGQVSSGSMFAFTAGDSSDAGFARSAKSPERNPDSENEQLMADDNDALSSSLRASNTGKTAKAHILKHPRRTVTRGTEIPCILKTKINPTLPGFVVCDSREEVRGAGGGTVMLLPRWTRFTGQIRQGLGLDQDRVAIVWTTVLTPDGIEIDINSPATDMQGAAGVDGQIDNHIGEKIGAILLYTVIEAGPALAVQAVQNQGNNNYSSYGGGGNYNQVYQPGQGVAGKLLERKLNRPPILIKNQGEELMIMVAQNWDLSSVIGLEPVQ